MWEELGTSNQCLLKGQNPTIGPQCQGIGGPIGSPIPI